MEVSNGGETRFHDSKPIIELYIRASTIDRDVIGATPFCQQWSIAFLLLSEKGLIDLKINVINPDDPPAEYEALNVTRRLPVCRVVRGVLSGIDLAGHVCENNDDIETLLERFQCQSLLMSREQNIYKERRRAERVFEDLYRHLGQFIRTPNDNGLLLLTDLRKLNDFLEEKRTRYLLADEPSFVDCVLMPRLQHVRVAAAAYKHFYIQADLVWLWRYFATMYSNRLFMLSCPLDRDVLAMYESKHGANALAVQLKFMPQIRTEDIPDEVFALLDQSQGKRSNSNATDDSR